MICPHCKTTNDADTFFCVECGASLAGQSRQATQNRNQPYWFALLLVPVIVIAVAIGFYKYYLPQGGFGCGGGCNRDAVQVSPCADRLKAVRVGVDTPVEPDSSPKTAKATEAGLRYWRTKHGTDQVAARVRDFGCHMQIDIVKDEKVIGSLRFQGGVISELKKGEET